MASNSSIHSQTLHSITHTKLNELAKRRAVFEQQRLRIIDTVQKETNAVKKVEVLAEGLKACFPIATSNGRVVRGASNNPRLEIDLKNFDRFLAQARYDPSVSSEALRQWQQTLLRHLEVQSLKYEYASLYGQLTTAWLDDKKAQPTSDDSDIRMEGFEYVAGGKKLESRRNWEQAAFTSVDIDRTALTQMLRHLFEATQDDSRHLLKAIGSLRAKVQNFERELASSENFNRQTLSWTIQGLLDSDLLGDEQRNVLRDFKDNKTVLDELADVLNMRITALADWNWGDEVLLEERRRVTGTYSIYMQEDLLEAVFLQYIGVRWSVFWKKTLNSFRKAPGVWKSSQSPVSSLDRKRRAYYLGDIDSRQSVDSKRLAIYRDGYFVSQLLDHETQESYQEEGDEEAESVPVVQGIQKAPRNVQMARQSMRRMRSSDHRHRTTKSADEDEIEDASGQHKPKNAMDAKQRLLHLLSAEILVKTWLHGEITCFRSQIEALFPSLPHSTVDSIMEYLGVSEMWRQFFSRFLKAPLRFKDEASQPRQRMNGTPGSHVLSEVFSEIVLFCLDFRVNQETGGHFLWRRSEDLWFWSSDSTTSAKAWSIIKDFVHITGLKLTDVRSGAVRMVRNAASPDVMTSLETGMELPHGQIRWGMLYLDASLGRFKIDQAMVDKHIEELSRQLQDKAGNVFPWIQAWNSYAAMFFTSNFGRPANCFGRQHVDDMLHTHRRIQQQIFASSVEALGKDSENNDGSVIEYLKSTIKDSFGTNNIPDGYFYFPTELGGLEVRNPFIGLLQVRDAVLEDPLKSLRDFPYAEMEAYKSARMAFEKGGPDYPFDSDFKPQDPHHFFSFEEYSKYRESLPYGFTGELAEIFNALLKEPDEESIDTDDNGNIKVALNSLGTQQLSGGIKSNWYSMTPYWKWIAQLYSPGMIAKFGGLNIVDPGLLPMGMVSLFRSGRTSWQD